MATYTLKKTDGYDMGESLYNITVTFEDENGKTQKATRTIPLPAKGTKKQAQAYADEFEATVKKGNSNGS